MPPLPTIQNLELSDEQPVLLFGWRPKPRRLAAKRMGISDEVGRLLLDYAKGAISEVNAATSIPFSEMRILQKTEVFVSSLDEYRAPGSSEGGDDSATDLESIVSSAAAAFPELGAEQVKGNNFAFYVVVANDVAGQPVAFVKMPYKMTVASPGRFLAGYAGTLTRILTPVFALSDDFDIVVRGQDVFVLNPENYLRLLSDAEVLQSAAAGFVATIRGGLVLKLSASTIANVTDAAEHSPRLARQLRRISRADWLTNVDAPRLQGELDKFSDLHHGMSVIEEEVNVPEEGVDLFLKILEQVVWKTPFAGDIREAQAYASVS